MRKRTWGNALRVLLLALLVILAAGAVPASAAAKTGFVTQSGKTYYINKDGSKHKGWLELNGKKYYFDLKTGVQLKGWAKDSDGKLVRYFTSGSGVMVTGYLTDTKGNTRYFDPKTGLLTRGWMTDKNGYKYYFTSGSGVMAKGWMENSKKEKRYFNTTNGRMRTGWLKNSKNQYRYFDPETGIMFTGLRKLDGFYYYFSKTDGIRYQKGFGTTGGKNYYFSPADGRAAVGWLTLDGKRYYFDSKGVRYENTIAVIGGKNYSFDKDGAASEYKPDYVVEGNNILVKDPVRGRTFKVWKTFGELPGLMNGKITDEDILAALCESEAGGQGHTGMVAVALCVLNRTLDSEFPSVPRYVVYQGGSFAQYSPVQNGALHKRLRDGQWYNKTAAYKAAKDALKIFDAYVKNGTPRTLKGFDRKDFNFMYFMSESSYYKQPLDFDRVDNFLYKYDKYVANSGDSYHMFFVNWISPKK